MPTGYTAPVAEGKITTFREFALQCARAFGALVTMRDDPADSAIPDEFKPDGYYARKIESSKGEMARLNGLTQSQIISESKRSNDEEAIRHRKYLRDRGEQIERYREMLAKVNAWEPPTAEHVGLKSFMVQQLEESIRFDSPSMPEPETEIDPKQWHADAVAEAERDLAYAKKSLREEEERCRSRTEWVKALRASLAK